MWAALALLVAATGLPHGALDARLAIAGLALEGRRELLITLTAYVALAVAMGGLFAAAPVAALVAFLAYSAVHFGGDFVDRAGPAAIVGAAVIALPALRFEDDVAMIFRAMAGDGGAGVAPLLGWFAVPLALGAAFAVRHDRIAAAQLGAYGAVALLAPPHMAFAVYFLGLHAPRHFRLVALRLDLSIAGAARAAAPYTLLATIAGFALALGALTQGMAPDAAIAKVIFVGLACLTVPHMMLETIVERPAWRARARAWLSGRRRVATATGR